MRRASSLHGSEPKIRAFESKGERRVRKFAARTPDLPGTDEASRTNIALPMGTGLGEAAISEVVEACASGST